MDSLTTRETQLPDTLEDLSQFVLVSKAKLNAYMIKLRAVNRLSDAQEIREQTFREAQEVASALIAAEQRIGEILLSIPKQTGNQYTSASSTPNEKAKTKAEVTEEMGYSKDQVSDYQRMAQNPAIVSLVLEQAEREGKVVSHSQVIKRIKEKEAEIERLHNDNKILARRAEGTVVEKHVEPSDYKEAKSKAKAYDAETRRLNAKIDELYRERNKLAEQNKELREQTAREQTNADTVASAIYFVAQCGSFIRDVGGYVWLADKIAELPDKEREGYIKAIMAIRDWSLVLINNIERSEYGKHEIDRISTESCE